MNLPLDTPKITFERDGNILIRNLHGKISSTMYESNWEKTRKSPLFDNSVKAFLTDYSHAEIITSNLNELEIIYDYIRQNPLFFSSYYFTRSITNPKIALAFLIHQEFPFLKGKSFSSREAAINWLNMKLFNDYSESDRSLLKKDRSNKIILY